MAIITLLTDFGVRDGYPGIMKGVILDIAPAATIVDLTHHIGPQNVREGALALSRAWRYFPADSIHVAVVDPGVGTTRRPLAVQLGEHYFVGPDNGLFSPIILEAQEKGWPGRFVQLNRPEYWLPNPSNIFHGRDIFAPVAAHLAAGTPLASLGDPIDDPLLLDFPHPIRSPGRIDGQVLHSDHFGNIKINVPADLLPRGIPLTFCIAGHVIQGLSRTFGDGQPGDLLALIDSSNDLCICVVNGNAARALGVDGASQTPVTVTWAEPDSGE